MIPWKTLSAGVARIFILAAVCTGVFMPDASLANSTASAKLVGGVFNEGFETGSLANYWAITGTNDFRTRLIDQTSGYAPHAGTYHMAMDNGLDSGTMSRNEATLCVDLQNYGNVVLSFWAAQYGEEYDGPPTAPFTTGANFDGVAISTDGITWWEVQPFSGLPYAQHSQYTVNLDTVIAAHGLTYSSTFRIRFNQYDNFSLGTDGISIDDIQITGQLQKVFFVNMPTTVAENAGTVTGFGTITTPIAPAANLTVTLTSSNPFKMSVPTSVVLPAGTNSVPFNVTILDNAVRDGATDITVTASATNYASGSGMTTVSDNEVTTITLTVPSNLAEGGAPATGTITLAHPAVLATQVKLAAAPGNQVTIPATVTIPANGTSATFAISAADDDFLDGSVDVQVSATVAGWIGDQETVAVADNDVQAISLSVTPASITEGSFSGSSGTVTLAARPPTPVEITLTSADPNLLTLSSTTVTVPAGAKTASFFFGAPDDLVAEPEHIIEVTATADGYAPGATSVTIVDNDPASVEFSAIPTTQTAGVPITVTLTAKDLNGAIMTSFTNFRYLQIYASDGTGNPVELSPAYVYFDLGVTNAQFTLSKVANGVTLRAGLGETIYGTSNAFDIVPGPMAGFLWSAIPGQQTIEIPFPVTLQAVDALGNPITSFTGNAAVAPVFDYKVGNGTTTVNYPFGTFYHDERTQLIFTSGEMGGSARTITGLSLDVTSYNTQLQSMQSFTIRLRHSTRTTLSGADAQWEGSSSNWTTCYSGVITITQNGSRRINFSTPFSYNGTSSLMVDFSFNNSSYTDDNYVAGTDIGVVRTLYTRTDSGYGNPISWSGTSNPTPSQSTIRPNVTFHSNGAATTSPNSVGPFVNGQWSGNLAVLQQANGVALNASSGGAAGTSNSFNVISFGDIKIFMPNTVTEGEGMLYGAGTIALTAPTPIDLHLSVSSSLPGRVAVGPATVVIPAGSNSADFDVSVVDDGSLNGSSLVQVVALVPGYASTQASLTVLDNESGAITVSLPASFTETDGVVANGGTVSLDAAFPADVTLALASSSSSELQVPSTLTIPAGQTSASFSVTVFNDTLLDGDKSVTVTASITGGPSGSKTVLVLDNEPRTLTLSLANPSATYREGQGVIAGGLLVTMGAPLEVQTTITITSDKPSDVPNGTLVVVANSATGIAPLSVLDDLLADGAQIVTLTASLAGFPSSTLTFSVRDNELHHFIIGNIPSPQVGSVAFPITVTAATLDGDPTPVFSGPAVLSAAATAGALSMSPLATGNFTNGVWTGNITITDHAADAVITASDNGGHAGTSNPFAVNTFGALHHFSWGALPPTQFQNAPFPTSIVARDATENVVLDYAGTTSLAVGVPGPDRTTGTGTLPNGYPLVMAFQRVRLQSLYPPAEVGTAGRLSGLSLDLASVPATQTLQNFTIRLKHTTRTAYATNDRPWDDTGWTTVKVQSLSFTQGATGWKRIDFTAPFLYNSTSHLMVDFSFDVPSTQASYPLCRHTSVANRSLVLGSNSATTIPTLWSGNNPQGSILGAVPNIRFHTHDLQPISPSATSAFANGVWNGSISVPVLGNNLVLYAMDGTSIGFSNSINVLPPEDADGMPSDWEITHDLNPSSDLGDDGALGDPDKDGTSNFLEYAFHLDPHAGDSPYFTARIALNPTDSLPYLEVSFRSLINSDGLAYGFQTSPDLQNWALVPPAGVQTLSITPDTAETVITTVRLLPAVVPGVAKYARIRVTMP